MAISSLNVAITDGVLNQNSKGNIQESGALHYNISHYYIILRKTKQSKVDYIILSLAFEYGQIYNFPI